MVRRLMPLASCVPILAEECSLLCPQSAMPVLQGSLLQSERSTTIHGHHCSVQVPRLADCNMVLRLCRSQGCSSSTRSPEHPSTFQATTLTRKTGHQSETCFHHHSL